MGLTVGGIRLRRKELRVTSQTLAATGLVGLYSVTFAAYTLYDFALFNTPVTVLLASITLSGAVFLADRWKSPLMAALGMLGGLLTPTAGCRFGRWVAALWIHRPAVGGDPLGIPSLC